MRSSKNHDEVNPDKIVAIISDLDGTLWDGILAEKQKIKLKEDYYKFLMQCYKKGIQIIALSKNDEKDVHKAFTDLGIEKDLFTAIISNWDPKYLNIEKIIDQTQFRPETVLFIDDNPMERTEVKTKLPKIHCIDSKDWKDLQDISAIKDRKEQSEPEILERINRYRTSINAKKLQVSFKGEDIGFLKKLKRELSIGEINGENLDRFTKLLVATHRINFNPDKFSDYEKTLDYLFSRIRKNYILIAISTNEGGISLGLTGEFVIRIEKNRAFVEDGAFSCGILGRDFEQKSILALIDLLKKKGIKELQVKVKLTSTNVRVRKVFEELEFDILLKKGESVVYMVKLESYKSKKNYEWIKVLDKPPELDYYGIPSVIQFFEKEVKPLFKEGFTISNLGSARGEVIGHLQKQVREDFYKFIKNNKIKFNKIDMEYYPEQDNIVANTEDLREILDDESQDIVLAIELLEHSEHFWQVINEAIRVCKIKGFILITVPSARHYPKHEYPIDLWRIGPKTLKNFFPKPEFKIIKLEKEGDQKSPRRTMILVKKLKRFRKKYLKPEGGKTDWSTGITVFP